MSFHKKIYPLISSLKKSKIMKYSQIYIGRNYYSSLQGCTKGVPGVPGQVSLFLPKLIVRAASGNLRAFSQFFFSGCQKIFLLKFSILVDTF